MSTAVDMLMKSLVCKGRIKPYIQFDTMRDVRSTYTMTYASSPPAIAEGASFSGNACRIRFTSCNTQSNWFHDFLIGSEDRMGYDTKKQLYLPMPVIVEQLRLVKRDADAADGSAANDLYKFGALLCILTAGSLRGHEGLYCDIAATRKYIDDGREGTVPDKVLKRAILTEEECSNLPSVCLCLVGKFKGEHGEKHHSIVLANTSLSGLETRWWIEKLLDICAEEGRSSGYAFWTKEGRPPMVAEYNALVRHYLSEIQTNSPALLTEKNGLNLIRYGISRTYRKSSETRARRAGIKAEEVKVMNRWQTTEQAKGRRARHAMIDHYSDARGLTSITWKYSYAL
jgi:hypothetical protein